MKIGYCSMDWSGMLGQDGLPSPGGAGWYRCGLPSRALAAHGIETCHGYDLIAEKDDAFGIVTWDKQIHRDLDVVVLQRWMELEAPDHISRARSSGQVVINDVDDHFDGLHPANVAFRTTHPKVDPSSNRNIYKKVLAASSGLTVSTPYLAERLTHLNERIMVVPNAIDLERWSGPRNVLGDLVVGWVGATAFRSGDLEELRGILAPFLRDSGGKFWHSGHAPSSPTAADQLGLYPDQAAGTVGMANIWEYPRLFKHFNAGVVPLRQVPFNFAKSNIKGLEYAASFVPFVASPTPAYLELQDHDIGLVARKPKHWLKALGRLSNPDERVRLAQTAYDAVSAYDMAVRWTDWRDAYADALGAT